MIFAAAVIGVRMAMIKDQARTVPCNEPLWKLLLGEVGVLVRRVGRWRVWSVLFVALVISIAAQVALSSQTPGPVLQSAWRWVLAGVMTVVVLVLWAVVHAVRSARRSAGVAHVTTVEADATASSERRRPVGPRSSS
jgi:type VI protein secretion system component VasK